MLLKAVTISTDDKTLKDAHPSLVIICAGKYAGQIDLPAFKKKERAFVTGDTPKTNSLLPLPLPDNGCEALVVLTDDFKIVNQATLKISMVISA